MSDRRHITPPTTEEYEAAADELARIAQAKFNTAGAGAGRMTPWRLEEIREVRRIKGWRLLNDTWTQDNVCALLDHIESLDAELARVKRGWINNAKELCRFAEEDSKDFAAAVAHQKRCFDAMKENRDELLAKLTAAEAAARAARGEALEEAAKIVEGVTALFKPYGESRRHPEWFEGGRRVAEISAAHIRRALSPTAEGKD